MVDQVFNFKKKFNLSLIKEEVGMLSIPAHEVWLAGFDRDEAAGPSRFMLIGTATKGVGKRLVKGKPDEFPRVNKGDVIITTKTSLTPAHTTAISAALGAHDHTKNTKAQDEVITASADMVALQNKVTAGIIDPDKKLLSELLLAVTKGKTKG